eukprot:6027982-Pyramimonas_sp.AAC.1
MRSGGKSCSCSSSEDFSSKSAKVSLGGGSPGMAGLVVRAVFDLACFFCSASAAVAALRDLLLVGFALLPGRG